MGELVFFDFDYTLARTVENVMLWSPRGTNQYRNKKYILLNPKEYNVIKKANDEFIDEESYLQFNQVDLKLAKPIESTVFLLKSYLNEKCVIKILSARPQIVEKYVMKFLENNKINHQNEIEFKGCKSSDPFLKLAFVESCVRKYRPTKITLYDDSKKVIECLENNFKFDEIELRLCLVEVEGNKETLHYKKKIKKRGLHKL